MMDEAAQASGYRSYLQLVDEVLYDIRATSPYFWVTPSGTRRIVIGPGTFGKMRSGQLITAAHELAHAEHFAEILRSTGNLTVARRQFFIPDTTTRYAIREVLTEELARQRVHNYLRGGISPQQAGDSTRYISGWKRAAGLPPDVVLMPNNPLRR
jgi:hypothetical protein